MNGLRLHRVLFLYFIAAGCCLLVAQSALSQTLTAGDPGANVNIVGPTPDPDDIRDLGLKQQNEPSCAIRPGDAACIICGFNDYRTVDVPLIADAWQGIAMSCDAGTTWTSRIAPGHAAHPSPIGTEFAADPRMIALPGMAIFNFIGGDRDEDSGVLAIQHWLEINKEDADYYEPGQDTIIADTGSSGRFIDKPDAVALLDKPANQGTIYLSTVMENPALGTITRDFPTGKLFVAYAVFTGSQSVKVLVKESDDWGKSWTNQTKKLSEDQNLVSGISLTAMGDSVLAVWRRAGDVNDFDSIMYAYTNNRGRKWTKAKVLADICSFDQISASSPTAVTFRTNDFPWAANDGENFYVFYSDRNYDGNSNCTLGRPRIVVHHASSGSGLGSTGPIAIDDSDDGDSTTIGDAGGSFQFMPAAFGANGKVQVAWYDTRREGDLPDGFFLDADSNVVPVDGDAIPVIADYTTTTVSVNRKVDVYTARITSDGSGGILKSAPERVSQFRIAANIVEDPDPENPDKVEPIALEGEALFANPKLYASGTLSFLGDYIAVAAQQFRYDNDGKVISNAAPNDDLSENNTDFFVAWTDNREVRGNIFPAELDTPTPYTPPQNNEAVAAVPPTPGESSILENHEPGEAASTELRADASDEAIDLTGTTRTTQGIEDPFDPMPLTCTPQVLVEDKTRDANIYGARIRDRVRLTAPTPTKPLTNLQRAFPIAISNANSNAQTYLLRIRNQPADAPGLGRASFRQLPAVPPFDQNVPPPTVWEEITVPPKSTFARTAFLVSNIAGATTGVQVFADGCDASDPVDNYDAYQGTCTAITSVTLGGEGPSGQLQQPDYPSAACLIEDPDNPGELIRDPDCTDDVLQAELHNPELINPELINPELINPELINPELINPELINPELINPELINPELINLGFANPELINPELINPELINPELINPELINPELINPELINSSLEEGITWVDYTYAIRNTGNVTTAFDADIEISGETLGNVDTQLIAWTMYITPTSVDCNYRPQVEKRVLATVNNPEEMLAVATIDNPFDGDVSAIATPGQRLFFTRRVFGKLEDLQQIQVSGFTSASQAANCSQTDLPAEDPDNPGQPYVGDYFCQLTLADERERILLDTQPPTFNALDNSVVPSPFLAADRPGGACIDLVGLGIVSATDNGEAVDDITCTDGTGQELCIGNEPGQSIPFTPLDVNGQPIAASNGEPVGAPVSCTAIDDAGNVAQVNLFIDVRDTGDPFFADFPTDPINVVAGADGTASLDFEAGITVADLDDVDSILTFACVANTQDMQGPNDPLPVGTTTIDCTVSDRSGNSFTDSFAVIVADETPPLFDTPLPEIPEVDAVDVNGAVVTYSTPTATDTGGGTPSVTCLPSSGSVFPIGNTNVICTADDGRGNTAEVTLIAVVSDGVPPEISVPDDFVVAPQGVDGAIVNYEVTVTDNIDPNPVIDCDPPSGAPFQMGETTVDCTASDSEGNQSSASFTVLVGYADGFGINPKKLNVRRGSSNPLSWGWLDSNGAILDTSYDDQILEFSVCGSSMPMFTIAGDPGSSGFRIKADNSWEYNWQSDDADLNPLPAGFYCIRVTSSLTGQYRDSPQIRVR